MTDLLCAVADCAIPNRHQPACPGDCRGCLPGRALDGAYLCGHHAGRLPVDIREAGELHAALELRLATSGIGGERTSGSPTRSPAVNGAAVEARTTIRHTLASWARLVAEERGVSLPGHWTLVALPPGVQGPLERTWTVTDTAEAMATWLAGHAGWLAAQPYADEAVDEFRELAHGQPRRVAYPNGTRSFDAAPCPAEGCAGMLRAILRRTDALLPSELVCSEDDGHVWPASSWLTLGRQLGRAA